MELLFQFLVLVGSLFILAKSSDIIIDNSVKIGRSIGLREIAVGFIFLSLATNLPEIFVAGSAVASQNTGVSIGNVLGSNIVNVGVVVAVMVLIKPLKVSGKFFKRLSTMLFYSSLIPLLLLLINVGESARIIGIILILVYSYFCYYSAGSKISLHINIKKIHKSSIIASILLVVGILGLLVSSNLVVSSASRIADIIGVTETLIGATIVSVGTSLPELSLCINAVKKNKIALALGNIIGSSLTKITLIFGAVLILSLFQIEIGIFSTLLMFVLLSSILLWRFFETERRLDKMEGVILLLVYFAFLLTVFGVQITILGFFRR